MSNLGRGQTKAIKHLDEWVPLYDTLQKNGHKD